MSSVREGFNDRASGEKPGPDKDGSYKEFRPGRGVLRNSKEKTQDWHSDLWGFLTPLACPHCGKDGKEVKIRGYIETPEGGGEKKINLDLKPKIEDRGNQRNPI